ncbi:MAG: hypothetical protein LBH02_02635 [Methanocalculaceae archaeon]|jgi:hypothetical protein|nr:hypothetical protein [Methanocalculaceae archaeon]
MNNLITKIVMTIVAFYILLMALEVINHPAVLTGAVIGTVLICAVANIFLTSREHAVHTGEMILIWVMILLFVFYGVCSACLK